MIQLAWSLLSPLGYRPTDTYYRSYGYAPRPYYGGYGGVMVGLTMSGGYG